MSTPYFFTMRQAASMLNLKNFGRTKLMALLKQHGILRFDNMPESKYIDAEYFSFYLKHVPGRYGTKRVIYVPVISAIGIELVKNLIKNNND